VIGVGLVDYEGMKSSPIYEEYKKAVVNLKNINLDDLAKLVKDSPEEAKCFFLNM
jgi:hypothetical protein